MQKNEKLNFNNEICKKLLEMIMTYYSKSDRLYNPINNMAIECGYEFMKNEYFKLINEKQDCEFVIGGSILYKYWNRYEKINK